MPADREEDAIGAAEAMAEATERLRQHGWMISSVTQPLLPEAAVREGNEAEEPAAKI